MESQNQFSVLSTSTSLGNSSNTSDDSGGNLRGLVEAVGEVISTAFLIWVALGCFLGLVRPESYNWVQPKWTMMGITFTMLGMGMTLTCDDLKGALAMPKELLAGFCLQYSIMPLSGFFISKILNLPSYYAAGLILVGCCPGDCKGKCCPIGINDCCKHCVSCGYDSIPHCQISGPICRSRCTWTTCVHTAGCAASCVGGCIYEPIL
ncbi:hypothetical protein L1987_31693 [Smallanthus sonchifolius]|uniref:Uncharacterized protein n=1 Tax=Smallanthus sonchifolius TaxID=185202 RepID=A0ACB9I6W9_9ASTR|nr:hypothetical protein L1987_31693 [Smallanthus sonchifolius]